MIYFKSNINQNIKNNITPTKIKEITNGNSK